MLSLVTPTGEALKISLYKYNDNKGFSILFYSILSHPDGCHPDNNGSVVSPLSIYVEGTPHCHVLVVSTLLTIYVHTLC